MMLLLPVFVIALVVFFPDFYIYFTYVNHALLVWKVLWWFPLIFLLGTILAQGLGWGYSFPLRAFFLTLVCVVLPKFLFTVVSFVGKCLSYFWSPSFQWGTCLGLLLAGVSFCCFLYGAIWGWKRLEVHEHPMAFKNLPMAFKGYKIVQITDLHVGTYEQDSTYFRNLVDKVNAQHPDLIVFTGDIVNSDPKELDPFMNIFCDLKAKDGVLSVVGNHDYCTYGARTSPTEHVQRYQDVLARERSFGWKLLMNENEIIRRENDSIAIVGVENIGQPPFPSKGDLKKALKDLTEGTFCVLLSHDPTHWRRETLPDTEIPLLLSGHSHAMQFEIFGWSPSSFTYKEWGGLYEENGQKLFISTGAGGNVPFRFGAWPEISVITLNKE